MAEARKETPELCRMSRHYQVLAGPTMQDFAKKMSKNNPEKFTYHNIKWNRFADGTDQITIEAFSPKNYIRGEHVLFCASFDDGSKTLSQLYVLIVLCESFVNTLTIFLPYFPTATMERVTTEGTVATANCLSKLLSNLPSAGRPIRIMLYDLHTLQGRFYFGGNTLPSMLSGIPCLYKQVLNQPDCQINAIAFPDDGAKKRFGSMFETYHLIVCGKVRVGEQRKVTIKDGSPTGKNVLIVDDLIQSGGTLYECGKVMKESGANAVYAYATHGVFPNQSWRRFLPDAGGRCVFDTVFVTNSIPKVAKQLQKDASNFKVLDLEDQVVHDLYN